jgi:hypothetical protein
METNTKAFRGIWLAIIVLAALVCSTLSGLTFYALGTPIPDAIGVAGAVFIGAIGLGMKMWRFLAD